MPSRASAPSRARSSATTPTGSTRALRFWAIGDAGFVDPAHMGNAAVRDAFEALNGGSSHTRPLPAAFTTTRQNRADHLVAAIP